MNPSVCADMESCAGVGPVDAAHCSRVAGWSVELLRLVAPLQSMSARLSTELAGPAGAIRALSRLVGGIAFL